MDTLVIFENRYAFMCKGLDEQRVYIYDIQNDNFMKFYFDKEYSFHIFEYPFLWLDENTIYFTGTEDKCIFTFNTITNEVKLHTNRILYDYGMYNEYSINFYSEKYDLYFDFDYVRTLDTEDKLHNIDFRSLYNCDYYIMNAVGVVRFYTDTKSCRLLKGYTNAKEVIAYFDANYEKVQDSTRLSFEFDGESCYYRMNSKSYTATTSPYNVTFSDLGFTGTLTGCSSMFDSQSSLTSVIKLPDTSNVTTMKNMFYGCTNLIYLDANEIVTNNVTNMQSMFYGCSGLTTLNASGWDVNNVTDMSFMFSGCTNLTTLDLSGWNPSNVTASAMFKGCTNLTSISFNNSTKSLIFAMYGMFYDCTSLTSLDLSSFNTSFVTDMGNIFYGCANLTTLNVSGWDMYDVTNFASMFDNCNNLTTIYAYGCSQTTIDKLNSAKPTNCTLVY